MDLDLIQITALAINMRDGASCVVASKGMIEE